MANPITPEQLARSGTEQGHQAALFCWCAINKDQYPELKRLFAIPNGGSRHMLEAINLVAAGVKSGVPDMMLPVKRLGCAGLFIELKRPKSKGKAAGIVSDEQDDWIIYLLIQGFDAQVCYGWEEARDTLIEYINKEKW